MLVKPMENKYFCKASFWVKLTKYACKRNENHHFVICMEMLNMLVKLIETKHFNGSANALPDSKC